MEKKVKQSGQKGSLTLWLGSALSVLLLFLSSNIGRKFPNPLQVNIASQLFLALTRMGVYPEFARVLVAQSAHETAYWTSNIYKKNNNLFGMRMPHVRTTTASEERNGYAYYDNLESSATDMVYWLAFNHYDYKAETPDMKLNLYVAWLKQKGYYTDTILNYSKGVNYAYQKLWS